MRTDPSNLTREAPHPIVFFDGVCGLCNGFVDFILAWDPGGRFRFAALQGETFRGVDLGEARAGQPTSIVLWDNHRAYIKSDAVLRIFEGARWRMGSADPATPRSSLRPGLRLRSRRQQPLPLVRQAGHLPSAVPRRAGPLPVLRAETGLPSHFPQPCASGIPRVFQSRSKNSPLTQSS